ncbi:TPA: hypothetical protein EYP66_03670 [Candidatus Poribacteria bacterium]|nr:hypothetical protein [Candidatus Poribacteria bacterium]
MKTKKLPIILILLCFTALLAIAQTLDEFEQWKKQEQEQFQQFKDERDKAFTEFLKKQWREMQLMQGLVPDEKPKPVKAPVYTPPSDTPKEPIPDDSKIIKKIPIPKPPPEVQPELKKPVPDAWEKGKTLNFTFFDAPLTVHYDETLKAPFGNEINKETISAFWEALSRSNYDGFITQAQYYRKQMKLNDWGYCLLLHKIGENIYQGDQNSSYMFVWFMLSKSGYMAKIGYYQDKVYLLLPSANTLYGASYFTYGDDSNRFYAVSLDKSKQVVKTLYTYDGTYPGADKLIDLTVDSSPNIRNVVVSKRLTFNYKDKDYVLPVKFNKNAVDFFEDYPQTNLEVYFDAPLSPEASLSLLTELRPLIEGKSEVEAVNILLRFVQTAFSYEVDQEQFGREKVLFPEESLFYNYSDCEDRSVLFAYLVRKLVGLEVIGLDFPGHIATGVRFNTDVTGDYVMYQNQKYIICDPTYINANIGMCMPQFKNASLSVIRINR